MKTADEDDGIGESDRGHILIRGFWARGTNCILDVCVTDTDATSYCKQTTAKVLETHQTDSSQSTGNTRKREEMY
jgi:hypothetical protein